MAILGIGLALFMPSIRAICKAGKDGFTVNEILFSVLLTGPIAIFSFLMIVGILLEWGYDFFVLRPRMKRERQKMVNECSEKEIEHTTEPDSSAR
jgi:hypothetical protein